MEVGNCQWSVVTAGKQEGRARYGVPSRPLPPLWPRAGVLAGSSVAELFNPSRNDQVGNLLYRVLPFREQVSK